MVDLKKDPNWRRFKRIAQARVDDLGVPIDVITEARRWFYVLDHGYDHGGYWNVERMDAAQVSSLLALLEEIGGEFARSELGSLLRARSSAAAEA